MPEQFTTDPIVTLEPSQIVGGWPTLAELAAAAERVYGQPYQPFTLNSGEVLSQVGDPLYGPWHIYIGRDWDGRPYVKAGRHTEVESVHETERLHDAAFRLREERAA